MNGPMNSCYYDDARNACYYCGQLTSQISCDNSPICHWVPSNQSCVFGPLASREAANDDAAWSVSKRLAVALPVAFGAVLVCVVVLGIVFKKFPCCHEQRPAKAILLDDGVESTTLRSIKDVSFDESSRTTGTGISSLRTTATRQVSQIVLSMPTGSATSVGSGGGSELALQAPALFQDGRVQRLKLLGRGANGSVYSCVLPDGYQVAMKEILLPPPNGKDGHEELVASILKEVSIVSSLDHPNVVRFFGSALETEEHRLTIFMELIPNGSLASMVSSMPEPMKEDVARVFVRQLVAALAYIHEKGVVHRDVKCDNILLTGEGRLKLTDFGASKVVGTGTLATRGAQTMIGTPYFMAPEILVGLGDDSDGSYGRRADIWSLGITVVEMMECGKAPWPDFPSTGAAFMHIATPGSLPIIPPRFSNEARDFVMQCCRRDPLERPTSKTLLTHPWLTSNFDVAVK
ncbi:protein kinase, putative [Bodo saltans]|uniref:Protein kinase, putative n=1 Tax=Bodo saltans TaxID=75058 RepID=A0A0S4JHA7_BODSA|nr:protein kinase, putative [Bodo saltans]|eukprot:CUG89623.1 protein kinase, putative [Bodo saltans]